SELIEEVAATAGNAPDRDAAAELLAGHADGEDKPEVLGDSAYGDAATRAGLEAQGFTVTAKCRLPATPQGGSPRTGSPCSWPRDPSPARPGKPPPSCRPPAAAGHRSGPGAPPARCGQSAPRRGAGAPSPSTRTKRCCSAPAPPRKTRPGSSATGRTGPSSSARSLTSPAGPRVGGGPAPVDWPASP